MVTRVVVLKVDSLQMRLRSPPRVADCPELFGPGPYPQLAPLDLPGCMKALGGPAATAEFAEIFKSWMLTCILKSVTLGRMVPPRAYS